MGAGNHPRSVGSVPFVIRYLHQDGTSVAFEFVVVLLHHLN